MTTDQTHPSATRRRGQRLRHVEFSIVYALSFAVLLIATTATRPFAWLLHGKPDRSILQEARDSAHAIVPYAFMG